jgi:nitrate reductase gamma subunit
LDEASAVRKAILALLVAAVPACAGVALSAFPSLRLPLAALVCYAACAAFLLGICARVLRWASVPVPFCIPVSCGQQRSLAWIKPSTFDNPTSGMAAAARMGMEVLFFRSLLRNTRCRVAGNRAIYIESRWLWLGAIAFHWALAIILLRHLRLFIQPVPAPVLWLQQMDAPFQIGIPRLYLSDILLAAGLSYLLWRRLADPVVRYISLLSDYLALWLLVGVAGTGLLMRHLSGVDISGVKQFALGLATFSPVLPDNVGVLFFAHLFMVCALVAYIPSSKLMHMGGVWLTPTRNLANNSRAIRHVNPWNQPVKTHTYAEWEAEYHDKLIAAGIPLEENDVETPHSN